MIAGPPKILLIGLGRFGRHHLDTWRRLAQDGAAEIVGAVTSSPRSAELRAREHDLQVHSKLTEDLLSSVDAVDIVSPSTTHEELIRRCLDRCHVLVEKPLTTDPARVGELDAKAKELGRVLMVNHLYRYHPITCVLKRLMADMGAKPEFIHGELLNPSSEADRSLDINLEFLHLLDLLDYLLGDPIAATQTQRCGTSNRISLRYEGLSAVLEIGWRGTDRTRQLTFEYGPRRLRCDFSDSVVTETDAEGLRKHRAPLEPRPLEASLRAFLDAIQGRNGLNRNGFPDAIVGKRAVEMAIRTRPRRREGRPRIAVIGAGVFGATAGIELARLGDVAVYERHPELLTEASFGNQWRQHSGFHYPRSYETVHEIQDAKSDFEDSYGEIVLPIDSYYATAGRAETITSERYIDMCRGMGLQYSFESPSPQFLDYSQITVCVKTDESVLDFEPMRQLIRKRLDAAASLELHLGAEVVGARLEADGRKTLIIDHDGERVEESFDYVINAAYANTNLLAGWLNLPLRRLRFDMCEMLVLEINMPAISMTVLDGPFTSIVATGHDNLFTLSQVEQSVLWSRVTSSGLPPRVEKSRSNRENMMRHARRYFPIVEAARFVESRYGLRTVVAHNEDYDGRPTVVTRHGFGCWSVLGGKILTCVTNAKEIAREIELAEMP